VFFFLLLVSVSASWAQHVVFEDIGKLAGATNYIHVALHLDLDDLEAPIQNFKAQIERTEKLVADFDLTSYSVDGYTPTTIMQDLIRKHQSAHQIILEQAKSKAQFFQADLDRLKALFPTPETDSSLPSELKERRSKRFLGIASSILGTFLGIFTQVQLRQMAKQMSELQERSRHLVEVTGKHTLQIQEHTNIIRDLSAYLSIATIQNPAITLSDLSLMERNITRALEIARNTFQTAQHRRLSIDFLRPEHLEALFQEVLRRSILDQATLIPRRPSDFFQLELSYLFDGQKALFMLHVPAVPKGALLRLLRFHSFPLVYQDTAFLPRPENDVIALSETSDLLSLEINYSDLMDCHHSNQFYVCEKHGVLHRHITSTCLGSLYAQKWTEAMSLCGMEVAQHREAVLHLTGNKYLVYTPVDITIISDCLPTATEGKGKQTFAKAGITEVIIPTGCTANLNDYTIIADSSVTLDTDIQHFQWNFEGLAQRIKPEDIKRALHDITHDFTFSRLTLSDLIQNIHEHEQRSWLPALLGTALACAIIGLLGVLLFTSLGFRFRNRLRMLFTAIKEEAVAIAVHQLPAIHVAQNAPIEQEQEEA
jgi:hypothetical protein